MKEYEVTKSQYEAAIKYFSGVIFHRTEQSKYFIKIGLTKYENIVKQTLKLD